MIPYFKLLFLSSSIFFINACATPVFDSPLINKNLIYASALNSFDIMKDQTLMWGGVILSGKNLKDTTELEILAYPLDGAGEPVNDENSYGRFLAIKKGYLELGEFAKDRQITVMAQLVVLRKNKVGDSEYVYPVVKVQEIKIWPIKPVVVYDDSNVRFRFGVGIHHGY